MVQSDNIWERSFQDNGGHYKGDVNPEKRYVALGFDDFSLADFTMIIPLLNRYGAKAVFNHIHKRKNVQSSVKDFLFKVKGLPYGHELGDHTWYHFSYIFDSPLFNGQDPSNPDGEQIPYPSNSQLRDDVGGAEMYLA